MSVTGGTPGIALSVGRPPHSSNVRVGKVAAILSQRVIHRAVSVLHWEVGRRHSYCVVPAQQPLPGLNMGSRKGCPDLWENTAEPVVCAA